MTIDVWPVGSAMLVRNIKDIPTPCKFIGAFDGYRFFRTEQGVYAIEE